MRSKCTLLSDVSERSEEQLESSSTIQHESSHSDAQIEEPLIPCIDIDPIDETPFSESFSGMFDHSEFYNTTSKSNNEMSYYLDQITDIQDVDSDWGDDDIDEILVLSRKNKTTERLNETPSTNNVDSRKHKRLLNNVFSLSEFDCNNMIDLRQPTSGTHAVRKRDTNRVYLMKAFNATPSLKWPFELRLLEMLTELDCSFLPCILRRIFEHQALFIILDSYPTGNMLNYVLQEGALDPDEVLFYISEIAEAISVLHDADIEHCDINPAKLMIGDDGHLVLTGFEAARNHGNGSSDFDQNRDQRTPRDCEYRAPEILLRWEHDSLVDCWGLGCLMYFMTYGKHPFPLIGNNQAQVYKQVLRGGSSTVGNDGRMEPAALDLMLQCLERNPRLRPNIETIKQHDYFITIDWLKIQKKGTIAPYIPSSTIIRETPLQKISTVCLPSPGEEIEADTAIVLTPYDWDLSKSTSSKAKSVYSVQARHSVQDLLPTIFRSPSLDELKMNANQSRTTDDPSSVVNVSSKSITDQAPPYESLPRSPIVNKLTREERLSLFWESLDKDINSAPPKPARVLGIPLSFSESQIQEPLGRTSRLRRQRSIIAQTNNRLSQFVTLSTMTTQNKLRNLRRPKSTPALNHPDVVIRSGSKSNQYDLPSGIKQIGSGIGFTYTVPTASKSKSSICTPAAPRGSHSIMPSIGVGIGLGLRTFGSGILRSKQRREGQGDSRYARHSQDNQSRCYDPQNMGLSRMYSVQEDAVGEVEAEQQDVFRYGSTWSLLPGEAWNRAPASPCLDQVSPVTATDSTACSPLSGF
ncbi:kinase-like domain-containing protein [Lentinula boryana]|uniref:Kinase-like domain-containing protein n=1 Tax=Lentinula boryana TaxID=40481 RepID=A0ABQ8QC66_9AGAR|nr:kinase-like domain-containing protein [Lentinula boryana]